MPEPMPKNQDAEHGVYEFVCVRCGVTEFLTLAAPSPAPRCRCGVPLEPIARVGDCPADGDVCGEAFLDELCERPPAGYYQGPSLVEGQVGYPEEPSGEEPEYGCLDHPHVEPRCQFCAIRQQRPNQHRLWCAVFAFRECSCGYQPR